MELSQECINDLTNLKEIILKNDDYEKFINYFFEIINKEKLIDDYINNAIVLNSKDCAYVDMSLDKYEGYSINGSINKIINFSKRLANNFYDEYKNIEKKEIDLLFIYSVLLHELAHIYQLYLARKRGNSLDEVYYLTINQLDKRPICCRIVYEIMKYRIFYERNANIISFRENRRIYENTKLEELSFLFYNYHLFNGYTFIKGKYFSPVEKTFKLFRIKETINDDSLTFEEKLTHGLPISETKKLDEFYSFYEGKSMNEYTYEDVKKKLLELK